MNEAIILAGGLGTRLRSAVPDLPKCMAPVAGKPFIDHVIDHLTKQGIQRFVLALGYMSDVIVDHVRSQWPDLDVAYSFEEEPLGTGGAIRQACELIHGTSAIVTNGDTLYKADLSKAIPFFDRWGADCVLLLKPMTDFDRYGVVELKEDGSIAAFKEKQHYTKGLINGGLYLLNTQRFLAETLGQKFSFEKDYLEALHGQRRMYGLVQDAYFIDIGIPEDFERANNELLLP